MLDWDKRKITFNETKEIDFENAKLIKALAVVDWDDDKFTEEESCIRDSFDSFFDFFHKLYSFQRSGLLDFGDFAYFYYYFELIRDIEHYKGHKELKTIIVKYIDSYHFIGIRHLLNQYDLKPEPLNIMTATQEKEKKKKNGR